jgi:hypothetical protein
MPRLYCYISGCNRTQEAKIVGRAPIGKKAMSGAERIRRWREAHPKPAKEPAADAALRAEIAKLRKENATLQASIAQGSSDAGDGDPETPRWRSERRRLRQLEAQLEERVLREIKKRVDEVVLPHFKRTEEEYKRGINCHNGYIKKAEYNKMLHALHPDSRGSITERRLAEAFDLFKGLERILVRREERRPLEGSDIPSTFEELDAARARATAARRAARSTPRRR